jgi:rod shape-determining protein MreC
MRYTRKRKKIRLRRLFLLVAILLVAITVVFVLFTVNGAARISNLTSVIVAPVVNLYRGVQGRLSDTLDSFSENKGLIEENRILKQRLEELEAQNLLIDIYREENESYKQLLNLQMELIQFELISAKILYKTAGNIQSGITINKGVPKGIVKGMPVLSGDKLFGIVKGSDLLTARVMTIFEKDFAVIARNARNHEILRVRGDSTAYFNMLLVCDYLPLRSDIQIGDIIETSILGEIYPNSIKIGVVESIEHDRDGIPLKAYIRPFVEPEKVDTVYVLDFKELENEQIDE